jgi:hypothetical protein
MQYHKGDTIKPVYPLPKNSNCLALAEGYFSKFGVHISNFYEVERVFPNKLMKDLDVDTFVILSPLSLVPTAEKAGNCDREEKDTIENRILLIVSNKKESPKITAYPNAISNQTSMAWQGYENIIFIPDGFEMQASKGQGHVFEYFINVKKINKKNYVQWIKLSETNPYREKIFYFKRKELPFEKYNRVMIDSLRVIDGL